MNIENSFNDPKKSPDANTILEILRRRGLNVVNLDTEAGTVTTIGGDGEEHINQLDEVIEAGKDATEAAIRNSKKVIRKDGTFGDKWTDQDKKDFRDRAGL